MTQEQMSLDEWAGLSAEKIDVSAMDAMIHEYQRKRQAHEEAKEVASAKYKELEEIENKVLSTLEATGKSKYFVDGIGTVSKISKYVVRVPKDLEDKRKMFAWLAENHGPDVRDTMLSINHQTLNSFYNAEEESRRKLGNPNFSIPGVELPVEEKSLRFQKVKV